MDLDTFIGDVQSAAEIADCKGETNTFELLDTAAYHMRELVRLLTTARNDYGVALSMGTLWCREVDNLIDGETK